MSVFNLAQKRSFPPLWAGGLAKLVDTILNAQFFAKIIIIKKKYQNLHVLLISGAIPNLAAAVNVERVHYVL
jgi:hypothetical protein